MNIQGWKNEQARMIGRLATDRNMSEEQAAWNSYGSQLAANSLMSYETWLIDHDDVTFDQPEHEAWFRHGFAEFSDGMREALIV
jgi:hypothetical protein